MHIKVGNKNSQRVAHLLLHREPQNQAVRNTDRTGRSKASLACTAKSFAEILSKNLLGALPETDESFAH